MQGVSFFGVVGVASQLARTLSNVDRCQTACCLRPRPRLVRLS